MKFIVKSRSEVAGFFGCHKRTIDRWAAAGMPWGKTHYDLRAIARWFIDRNQDHWGSEDAAERKKKLDLEKIRRLTLQNNETEKRLVSRPELEGALTMMGRSLADQLEGFPERVTTLNTEQRATLRVEIGRFLNTFKVQGEKITNDNFPAGG